MSRPKMPQMIFARQNHAPPTAWWVCGSEAWLAAVKTGTPCDREKFNELRDKRLPHMQPAQPSDLTYGPHRGGSGYGSLPPVKGAQSA